MSKPYGSMTKDLMDAWSSVFTYGDQCRPLFFDERRGWLIVECINKGWVLQLRLGAPKVTEKLNAALPAPIIKKVIASVREAQILVTGSRSWTDREAVADALLEAWHDVTQVIDRDCRFVVSHGDCPQGADAIAKQWAVDNGVIQELHPADWSAPCAPNCPTDHRKTSARHGEYCPMAGHRRNQFMVDLRPDLVLAFQMDQSRGTSDCIRRAKAAGIPVRVHRMESPRA